MESQINNNKIYKLINDKQEIEFPKKKERNKNIKKKSQKEYIALFDRKKLENNNKYENKKIKVMYNFNKKLSLLKILFIAFLPFTFSQFGLAQNNSGQSTGSAYNNQNQITLIVKGKNIQQIMSPISQNILKPDFVIINNNEQQEINNNMKFNFDEENSTVVLKWNSLFTSCKEMFKTINCIISIDLSNFNTKNVTDMYGMFNGCSQLQSINFKNVDTSKVKNMGCMFCNTPITSLDLSNFNTAKVERMQYMFSNCYNLISLDLSNFITNSVTTMESMFDNAISLVSLDLSKFNTSSVTKMNYMFARTNSLKYINLISFEEKKDAEINDIFTSSINNLIFCINKEKAPKISYMLKNSINNCEIFENNSDSKQSHLIEITQIFDNNENIQSNKNEKDIDKTQERENDNIINTYKTENPENASLIVKFKVEDLLKEIEEIMIENITFKDEIIQYIKKNIINRNFDSLITNISKAKEDLLVKANDTLYQISTTEHQTNNKYKNISTLNLGDCEDRLKTIYNIDKSLPLIIFKIDYYKENSFIPVICYEVYHPENKSQLDLNYCKDILVSLNIPVSIDEDNYFKYDPNSGYYTDECYTYTTENGTDIILDDRQNEYNDNNYSLCENNCTLIGYDNDSKKVSCECKTKSKISLISEIIEDENIFTNYFNDTNNYASSIVTMKCIYQLFTKEGLLKNIGNYIIMFSIIIYIILSILFYKIGYHIIETEIEKIIKSKMNNNDKLNLYEVRQKKKKYIKKKSNLSSIGNPMKKKNLKNNSKKKKEQNSISFSKMELKSNPISNTIVINNNINIFKGQKEKEKVKEKIKFKNFELNLFNYKEALKYDKRTFSQYYFNLLKIKNLILFSFYPIEDYNVRIIKLSLFILFFDICFATNTLFFDEFTIHQIYINNGAYNIKYLMPQIIYSFIITYFISNIIKFFSLSERNIYKIKIEKKIDNLYEKAKEVKRCLIIKYIIFYITSILFLFLFWFYLSSFCSVYKNSQIYLFKNTILSFSLVLLFQSIFITFPIILRIYSLNNKGSIILFKLSKIMVISL